MWNAFYMDHRSVHSLSLVTEIDFLVLDIIATMGCGAFSLCQKIAFGIISILSLVMIGMIVLGTIWFEQDDPRGEGLLVGGIMGGLFSWLAFMCVIICDCKKR